MIEIWVDFGMSDLIRNLVTTDSDSMTWWPSLAERTHDDRKIRSHP